MDFRINHKEILSDLYNFATTGNGILTGRPGVGKSYELNRLVNILEEHGVTVLFLPIDKIIAESDADLQYELNLKADIFEYLATEKSVSSEKKGIVIIDAFDAARSGNKRILYLKLIRKIIGNLSDEWNVLVAVRIYDAKRSSELLNIFSNDNKTDEKLQLKTLETSKEIPCRHVILPELNSDDITNILNEHPFLSKYSHEFNPRLKKLLARPYNISLIENLIKNEKNAIKLNSIFSEVQLLDLYWNLTIEQHESRINYLILLNRITEMMVKSHSLSVSISDLPYPLDDHLWGYLFSNEILINVGINQNKVAYGHNILFDYAVSRLTIVDDESGLINFLKADKSNAIFLIPSIHYYLTKIWFTDKELFKEILLRLYNIEENEIPFIAKTLPIRVIALEAESSDDLLFLLNLYAYNPELKKWLRSILIPSIISLESEIESAHPNHKFWLSFIEHLIQNMNNPHDLNFISWIYTIQSKDNNVDIQRQIGNISRGILSICFNLRKIDPNIDKFASHLPVILVVKTFGMNPKESKNILETIYEIVQEEDFELSYLISIAYNITDIIPFDYEFVSKFYNLIFSRSEESTKQTEMGKAGFLTLTSNRRQDFNGIRYYLGQKSGYLIDTDLKSGLRTLLKAINYAVCRMHVVPYIQEGHSLQERIQIFSFHGKEAKFLEDFCYIWSDLDLPHEPESIMQTNIRDKILEISADPDNKSQINIILNEFGGHAAVAILWRDLIKIVASNPKVFSSVLFDLSTAKPLQLHSETIDELAELIEYSIEFLSDSELEEIAQSIIKTYADIENADYKKYTQKRRDYLLSKIPQQFLLSDSVREAVDDFINTDNTPPQKPIQFSKDETRFGTEEEILRAKGIDGDRPEDMEILFEISIVKKFNEKWINEKISEEMSSSILISLKKLYLLIENPIDKISNSTIDYAWEEISTCAKIVASGLQNSDSELFEYSRNILLKSANISRKGFVSDDSPENDLRSWSPTPQTNAAEGLLQLYALQPDDEIWNSINKLSRDKDPVVRLIIMSDLYPLVDKSPTKFWEKIDEYIDNEKNYKIFEFICNSLIKAFNKNTQEDIEKRIKAIWNKCEEVGISGIKIINNNCFITSTGYFAFSKETEWAIKIFDDFIQKPGLYSTIRPKVVSLIINKFFKEPTIFNHNSDNARILTSKWLNQILRSVFVEIENVLRCNRQLNDVHLKQIEDLYGVIDEYITRFFFIVDKKYNKINDAEKLNQAIQTTYNLEKTTIELILNEFLRIEKIDNRIPLRGGEIQYMMGILDSCLSQDPKNVLKLAVKTLKIGNWVDYSSNYLGKIEIEKFIGHLLADHREILEESMTMQNFTELLDHYVKGNSPESMKLIMSIDLEYN